VPTNFSLMYHKIHRLIFITATILLSLEQSKDGPYLQCYNLLLSWEQSKDDPYLQCHDHCPAACIYSCHGIVNWWSDSECTRTQWSNHYL